MGGWMGLTARTTAQKWGGQGGHRAWSLLPSAVIKLQGQRRDLRQLHELGNSSSNLPKRLTLSIHKLLSCRARSSSAFTRPLHPLPRRFYHPRSSFPLRLLPECFL